MSTDAVMSTSRDSGEDLEGEMMAIEKKSSNVSMPSLKTNDGSVQEAENRDDSGASEARSEPSEERQVAAINKSTTKAAQKRNAKGRQTQPRQPPPQDGHAGHFQQHQRPQRGAMAYRTQMQMHANANGPLRGPYGNPTYGYSSAGPPHESYRGAQLHPQYNMPPLPHHHPGQQSYGAPPSAPFHPSQHPNFGAGPYGHPPPHMYPYHAGPIQHHHQHYQPRVPIPSSSEDTASIGSTKSKGSKSGKSTSSSSRKKRTIDGVDPRLNIGAPPQGMTSAFTFRRTHSSASTSSTVTAGNNTSTETPHLSDDSPHKARNHLPPLSSRPDYQVSMNDDSQKQGYHRRNFSGASTTSSLSVGGLSLSSYETRGSKDDALMVRHSPKRRRGDDGPATSLPKISTKDDDKEHRENLFLTLSTSPINSDIEATPVSKNTKKTSAKFTAGKDNVAVQELQSAQSMESISKVMDRNSDTPTPPVPTSSAESDMITDEHLLNLHLRGQTFTPLPHIGQFVESRDGVPSPPGITTNPSFSTIGGQLSWDITGDAPSLGAIGDWEEDPRSAQRPGSVASLASGGPAFAQWKEGEMVPSSHYPLSGGDGRDYHSVLRLSVLSPHSDIDMEENAGAPAPGGTTPIPFYDHQRENGQLQPSLSFSSQKHGNDAKPAAIHSGQMQFGDPEHIYQLFVTNGGRGTDPKKANHSTPMDWNGAPKGHPGANYMRYPPAPLYTSSEQSPMNGERGFFPNANNLLSLHQANDRIRNLRGRAPPQAQRMPMAHHQLPPHIMPSYSHNLTSPIGPAPSAKGATWSPHALHSPHHVAQQDSNSSSKRKCLAMKPPIPTKFQGDMEKYKNAHVPEFANLVNFPSAMSQSKHATSNQLPDGMKCCVMCGSTCPCSLGTKPKKSKAKPNEGSLAARNGNVQKAAAVKEQQIAIIPTQNKGLCTLCDVNVWVVASSGLEIKWCKGCKNFRPWAAFGDKGLATKCLRCRDRQREKYAIQKEEKERIRMIKKAHKAPLK